MIVDDEPTIRKGLKCFIDWTSLNCEVVCEANNGIEAKQYLQLNKVHIVICDVKMPGMDGIELSKYIYENFNKVKIILLTAFSDFSYAQSAIKYNVADYITKNNPTEKIPEAINKVKELIRLENEKESKLEFLEKKIKDNSLEINDSFVRNILNGIISEKEFISTKLQEIGISPSNFFVISYEFNFIDNEGIDINTEDQSKYFFAFRDFLELAYKNQRSYNVLMNRNLACTIISFENSDYSQCIQSLLKICNEILAMVENFIKLRVSIGISCLHNVSHITTAYNESLDALAMNFYNLNEVYIYSYSLNKHKTQNYNLVEKYNNDIISKIYSGDYEDAMLLVSNLFEVYKKDNEPVEYVKVSSIFLVSLCFRMLINNNLNLSNSLENEDYIYKKIQSSKTINSLYILISKFIKLVTELLSNNEKQHNYLISETIKFIRKNYNKDINLKAIAENIHINSCYLSRLYKKETGESIIDSLNKLRIEKAKELLKDPTKKVFEVAFSVGIEDAAYFTHVFIKYTGISPKEYRSSLFI
jgi:two-component system response regulator YesN